MLQLELNLWDQLREAEAEPMAIDFQQLCLCFDVEMERLSAKERMERGAEAMAQLAEVLAIRAESYFKSWQQRFDPTGPMLESDDFSDLVRQSFSLDLDELISEPEPTYRLPSENEPYEGSMVAEIDKEDLFELLEDSEVRQDPLNIEQLEYAEDLSAWIAVVRSWLARSGGDRAELVQVIQGTAMEPVMVWMALLLGGFHLEKRGDFYLGDVMVG